MIIILEMGKCFIYAEENSYKSGLSKICSVTKHGGTSFITY